MASSPEFITHVAEYAGLDSAIDDVQGYIDMAEDHLLDSGIAANEAKPLYRLAVSMLVTVMKDQKVPGGGVSVHPAGLSAVTAKLKYAPAEEEG